MLFSSSFCLPYLLSTGQVLEEAGSKCGIRSICVYGGVPKREQVRLTLSLGYLFASSLVLRPLAWVGCLIHAKTPVILGGFKHK